MEQQAFDAEAIKSESNEVSWTKKNDKQLIFHLIEEMKSQTTKLGGCRGKKNRVTMLVHTSRRFIYYLFEFKYFNYLYKKNTELLLQKKKKKLPHTNSKNYTFLS